MPCFHLVSLFPEFFTSPLSAGLLGRARAAGVVSFAFHDPRQHSMDKHRHVDDRPYGGGPGMVMQAEPLARTLRAIPRPGRMLLLTPGGRPFTQAKARSLATEENLTLICGRYEGIDARLADLFPLEPVSVGEAVLNGGETAALAVVEAVARLVPGFMGKEASGEEESFAHGLLEYPHYTRPENLEGLAVPPVLLSGDHKQIARWRRQQAVRATLAVRPDLLQTAPLTREDALTLADTPRLRPGRNLSLCLLHAPVWLDEKKTGVSSLTNLDIHDIARLSRSYALDALYVVTPLRDQLQMLETVVRHWTREATSPGHADRAEALGLVRPAASLQEAVALQTARYGQRPRVVGSSALWPVPQKGVPEEPPLTPPTVRQWCAAGPVMLCLGTARGLAPEALAQCDGVLRPLRYLGYNHLSVRSAAAILTDRILGDYY